MLDALGTRSQYAKILSVISALQMPFTTAAASTDDEPPRHMACFAGSLSMKPRRGR